jgi:amidohydrolase
LKFSRLATLLGVASFAAGSLVATDASTTATPLSAQVDSVYKDVEALYLDLHQNPELSLHEQKTAAKLAGGLRQAGYEVTTGVGGTGVVGVLRNGSGPTVMLRTDTDALPVEEKTGLAYASHVRTKDDTGADVPVMHACGHDIHMASWMGTARIMAATKDRWHGTLVLIGQPAEERVMGAKAMLADGLYTRFPKPDFALAIHDTSSLPAGKVGFTNGFAFANSDSLHVVIFGKGGHGAHPQSTVDPIVIAARTILALQTLVSRENDPLEPAVVTVGQIHAGTKANIISDQAVLDISVRSFKDEVRNHLLSGIERIVKAEAVAAGAPKEPTVTLVESTHATYNDPALGRRLTGALGRTFGAENVVEEPPIMGSEDFSEYSRAGVPAYMIVVGAVEPGAFKGAQASGKSLPSPHSPLFAPDREPTLKTAVATEVTMLMEFLGK